MTTTPEPARRLGREIRKARTARKMSLRELERRSNVPRNTLSRLEEGQVAHPALDLVSTVAIALEVAPADYFAVLGYPVDSELPGLVSYLQARYSELSPEAITEIRTYMEMVAARDGVDLEPPPHD